MLFPLANRYSTSVSWNRAKMELASMLEVGTSAYASLDMKVNDSVDWHLVQHMEGWIQIIVSGRRENVLGVFSTVSSCTCGSSTAVCD